MKVCNKIFHIQDNLYGAQIYLILASRENLVGITKKRWGDETPPDPHYCACSWKVETLRKDKNTTIDYIIWMPQFDWSIPDQTTLVHEIFHTASKILTDRGIKHDPNNEEPFACCINWIMSELWNALKPYHPKTRKHK
jgi:hypothetical protein